MKRISRTLSAAVAGTVATTGLLVALPGSAQAANLGQVTVSPTSGTDSTGFGGSATTACPAGTDSSFWSLEGPSLAVGEAFLGDSTNAAGTGAQSFSGASIANIETVHGGGLADGTYFVQFSCFSGPTLTDTYRANLNYTSAGTGSWNITPSDVAAVNTTTALSASPVSPQQEGTNVTLTATVTPASGAAPSAGSVEFFDGPTSLGIDSSVVSGVASIVWPAAGATTHSLTAVYTPGAGWNGSTAAPLSYTVTATPPRPTTSTFTASPTSGAPYQSVNMTCAVDAGTFQANGTAIFKDGSTTLGSAPVVNGVTGAFSTSTLGTGSHSLFCDFVGTAPYQNSTSNTVSASYASTWPDDPQTVTVSIPEGSLSITTPYTPTSPLSLGTAVLDASDSTYSTSAPFTGISITDSRAGNLGWNASLISGAFTNGGSSFPGVHAGLTGLAATQVPNNALLAGNVALTNWTPYTPGLGVVRQFASYASGLATGTASIAGTFGVDQVPTSTAPGLYTATVTFSIQ